MKKNEHHLEQEEQTLPEDNLQEETQTDEVIEEVQQQVDEKQLQIDELQNRLIRLQADFDNFRRRSRSEAEQLSLFVSAEIVSKFLPVLDNFVRAIDTSETQDSESLRKGMELIYRQFEKSLSDTGTEKINALGEQFDPNMHDAVMSCQNDELPDGQIESVFEEGYKIKEKVIRPSKVRVVNNS